MARHKEVATRQPGTLINIMKLIKINRRNKKPLYTKVDDRDFEFLNKFKWSLSSKYPFNDKLGTMHRLINKTPKGFETDHINMDTLDNRRRNLRTANQSQNNQNRRKQNGGTSKYKGVSWCKRDQIWRSRINLNRNTVNLGYYHCEIEAAKSYDSAANELFGEFARTNF